MADVLSFFLLLRYMQRALWEYRVQMLPLSSSEHFVGSLGNVSILYGLAPYWTSTTLALLADLNVTHAL